MKLTDFNLDDLEIEPLSDDRKRELDRAFESFVRDLEKVWPEHVEKMRRMKVKNYRLSLTRVIG
jgi:hypothetical protein